MTLFSALGAIQSNYADYLIDNNTNAAINPKIICNSSAGKTLSATLNIASGTTIRIPDKYFTDACSTNQPFITLGTTIVNQPLNHTTLISQEAGITQMSEENPKELPDLPAKAMSLSLQ